MIYLLSPLTGPKDHEGCCLHTLMHQTTFDCDWHVNLVNICWTNEVTNSLWNFADIHLTVFFILKKKAAEKGSGSRFAKCYNFYSIQNERWLMYVYRIFEISLYSIYSHTHTRLSYFTMRLWFYVLMRHPLKRVIFLRTRNFKKANLKFSSGVTQDNLLGDIIGYSYF